MADITQTLPTDSLLGGEEDGDLLPGEMDTMGGKLGGLPSVVHDCISTSSHMASSLGINPHTLQVGLPSSPSCLWLHQRTDKYVFFFLSDHEGISVC